MRSAIILGLLALPAAAVAAPASDPILVDFVKMQDAAHSAVQLSRCAPDPVAARSSFHRRFDLRLLGVIQTLQKKFSDAQLKAAETEVHGSTFSRVEPACPDEAGAVDESVAAYDAALTDIERRIGLAVEDK